MSFKSKLAATALFTLLPVMAQAHMIIEDAYARASGSMAASGAVFLSITNHSDTDDRVVSAHSEAAERVELHTHIEDDQGVMRMREIEGGMPIAAGETHMLMRGGDHIMFLGLTEEWQQGDELTLTIEFEHAEPVTLSVTVDNERMDAHGSGHGGSGHGSMDHSESSN